MPTVTDWISSIGSLVGALTGVGALIVAILSYRKSARALAADAQTRGAVGSTLDAMEALGPSGETFILGRDRPYDQDKNDAFEAALTEARRGLEFR